MPGTVLGLGDAAADKAASGRGGGGGALLELLLWWGNRQCTRKHTNKIISTLTGGGTRGAELENEGGGLQIKEVYIWSLLEYTTSSGASFTHWPPSANLRPGHCEDIAVSNHPDDVIMGSAS